MRRRFLRLQITALSGLVLIMAAPAGAQVDPDSGPEIFVDAPGFAPPSSGSGGFGAFFGIAVVLGIGGAIYKIMATRDMGLRRGLSHRDATTAALFSDDEVMSTMILKPETDAATDTIEERLTRVDSLLRRGIISAEEAASRRAEILDEI